MKMFIENNIEDIKDDQRKAILVAQSLHDKLAAVTFPIDEQTVYDCQMLSEVVVDYIEKMYFGLDLLTSVVRADEDAKATNDTVK